MLLIDFFRKYREKKLYRSLGKCGRNVFIGFPNMISKPSHVYMDDFSRIMNGSNLVIGDGELRVGKFSSLASNVTVVTDNHTPTVGVPYFFTGTTHLNDRNSIIEIKEDCWIGACVILLPGAKINRGCVVAAGALVNKEFPPYSVVAGIPAKIIGVKFGLEEIIEHEKSLYEEKDRFSLNELNELFEKFYLDKKVMHHALVSEKNKETLKEKLSELGFDLSLKRWYEL